MKIYSTSKSLPLLVIAICGLACVGNIPDLASPSAQAPSARPHSIGTPSPIVKVTHGRARIVTRIQKIAHPQPMGSRIIRYPEVIIANKNAMRAINDSIGRLRDKYYNPSETPAEVIGMTFHVNHNGENIVSLTLEIDWNGPYPTGWDEYCCYLLTTGEEVTARTILDSAKTKALLSRLDVMLQAELNLARQGKLPDIDSECDGVLPETAHFKVEDLKKIQVRSEGINFYYSYMIPIYARVCKPPGEFFLSYPDLSEFMLPDSPLAGVVRAAQAHAVFHTTTPPH